MTVLIAENAKFMQKNLETSKKKSAKKVLTLSSRKYKQ